MRLVHFAIALLALGLAAPAAAQSDLNSLRGESRSVNDARDQGAASLDDSMLGGTDTVDRNRGDGSTSIDNLRRSNRGWQPPECGPRPPAGMKLPPAGDADAWELALGRAEDRHKRIRERWQALETGASVARPAPDSGVSQKAATQRALEEARSGYGEARCELKSLLASARHGGLGVTRLQPYVDRAPADLRPW